MSSAKKNSFGTRTALHAGNDSYEIYRLSVLERAGIGNISRLPFSLKVLLENLLRHEDGQFVFSEDIHALAGWDPSSAAGATEKEISFMPARVLLQDFTGVPAVVDLAAMRGELATDERWSRLNLTLDEYRYLRLHYGYGMTQQAAREHLEWDALHLQAVRRNADLKLKKYWDTGTTEDKRRIKTI